MGGEIQERVSAKKYPLGEEKKLLYTVMSSKLDNITLGKKKITKYRLFSQELHLSTAEEATEVS